MYHHQPSVPSVRFADIEMEEAEPCELVANAEAQRPSGRGREKCTGRCCKEW